MKPSFNVDHFLIKYIDDAHVMLINQANWPETVFYISIEQLERIISKLKEREKT